MVEEEVLPAEGEVMVTAGLVVSKVSVRVTEAFSLPAVSEALKVRMQSGREELQPRELAEVLIAQTPDSLTMPRVVALEMVTLLMLFSLTVTLTLTIWLMLTLPETLTWGLRTAGRMVSIDTLCWAVSFLFPAMSTACPVKVCVASEREVKLLKYWFAEALYNTEISSAERERLKINTSSIVPFHSWFIRSLLPILV